MDVTAQTVASAHGLLPGFEPTLTERVRALPFEQRLQRAIDLLKEHEPAEGYYLAFSGGKDSIVIDKIAQLSGVKFDSHYNNTTIDPPELVHFIKTHYAHIPWNHPQMAMMKSVAELPKVPPTRTVRWCCELYKEQGGDGRVKIMGVRAAESKRRENWHEISRDMGKNKVVCPIVFWTDDHVWEFIHHFSMPYCRLYDEGMKRIGCVGCMLAGVEGQDREFKRWPRYEANWKRAITANWEKWHNVPREDGKPRFHAKFKSAEEFWIWWRTKRAPDVFREDCQSGMLWTNQELEET